MAYASARDQVKPPPVKDLYAFNPEEVEIPPTSLWATLRRIGPGMILSASIVGSGELIATTTLGAEVGYVALWIIILSCFVKVGVQAEIGRYTIATGETGLAAFNRVPGPRARVGWVVWFWAVVVLMTMFQIGAMFGGVAQAMNQIFPAVAVPIWVVLLLGLTLALLLGGGYDRVEKLATLKVALFTMLTLLCAMLLLKASDNFAWPEIQEGLRFQLPGAGLATAIAVFGITGVGAAELMMYPYWCVEKGYARFVGPRDGTASWEARARGWIRVMHADIIASMIIYTVATIAFYFLGAGILHAQGLVPAAQDMIPVLSRMYTETLGPWSLWLFYAGAIATLYGTIFAATAANSRVYADMCRLMGLFRAGDYVERVRWRNRFIVFLTIFPAGLFLVVQSPVQMVKLGGVAQALLLTPLAAGTLYLRYKHLPREIRSGPLQTLGLWISALAIISLMGYYAYLTAR